MATKKSTKVPDEKEQFAEIEKRAFEIYHERVKEGLEGDDSTDWYQAEKEIKEKYKGK